MSALSLASDGMTVAVRGHGRSRLCGWGAELASIVAEEMFWHLDGPIVRVTTPHIPLPSADALEDAILPSAEKIVENVKRLVD